MTHATIYLNPNGNRLDTTNGITTLIEYLTETDVDALSDHLMAEGLVVSIIDETNDEGM